MKFPRDGTEKTYYPDGKLEGEITYVDGQVNGVTRHWHPNGVLESEIPVRNNVVEGIAKFWNDKGELLGTYEIRNGTGIQKMWFQNGQLVGETQWINGQWTGRQTAYFEDGTLAGETYYIRNQKISKKKYYEACKKDPSLPRYEDEPEGNVSGRTKPKDWSSVCHESAEENSLAEKLLAEPGSREVLEWLREHSSTRTLGELPTREASIEYAKEIYSLGANKVTAVKIDRYPDGEENTGRLVVTLPSDLEARARIFEWHDEQADALGFDPETDVGQMHLLLMLD